MDANNRNILYEGKDALLALRAQVMELDGFKTRIDELSALEDRSEKNVRAKEKQISGEISDTVKKRKGEISGTFKGAEKDIRAQEKKVKAKKERDKKEKVAERIVFENEGNVHQIAVIKDETKNLFKADHVPAFYNTGLYYCLFIPKTLTEHLVRALAFVFAFAGIPYCVYSFVPAALKTAWFVAVIYVVLILILGSLAVLILSKSKGKYNETVIKGRHYRNDIQAIRRDMKRKGRQIKKDKDESLYGLENYDNEIAGLKADLDATVTRRKNAINEFENNTKNAISNEITERNRSELEQMKAELEATKNELKELRGAVKAKSLFITEQYEAFMGKEFVNVTCIDKLVEIIDAGKATTVGDALAAYKVEDKN